MLIHAEYVPAIKALADVTRLQIVEMLSCGELCACKILEKFQITQPTLSYHMRILTESGLVISRKDGAWVRYCLNPERVAALMGFLQDLTAGREDCPCHEE